MLSGRRLATLVFLAIGLALASAPVASAKIWFKGVAGRTVAPGQLVRVYVPGCEGNPACENTVKGVRIFVSPWTSSRRVSTSPEARRFVGRVGSGGKLAFRIPSVRAGEYRLIAYVTWPPSSRFLPVSGAFRIGQRP